MSQRAVPKISKWPFYIADLVLVVLAYWLFSHYSHPLAPWTALTIVACVLLAALLAVWPYRLEYASAVKLAEAEGLADVGSALAELEQAGQLIKQATSQWQGVQEHAQRTTQSAREIADRMTAEARAFSEFMTRANDSEKATLRLEVDKLRRAEGQWLQITTHILDHIHALHQAGIRSGQANLAAQLGAFQTACRDVVRRVGLFPIEVTENQAYDPEAHDLMEGQPTPGEESRIGRQIAAGYTFQGQVIRRPLVVLRAPETTPESVRSDDFNQSAGIQDQGEVLGETIEIVRDTETVSEEAQSDVSTTPEPERSDFEEFRLESEGPDEDRGLRTGNA